MKEEHKEALDTLLYDGGLVPRKYNEIMKELNILLNFQMTRFQCAEKIKNLDCKEYTNVSGTDLYDHEFKMMCSICEAVKKFKEIGETMEEQQ